MLYLFLKFVFLYTICTLVYFLFKVSYYSIGKKYIKKTSKGSLVNWALKVFIKNGTKLDQSDYFTVGAFVFLIIALKLI
ncbi:hypothetical protein ERICIV_01421 [Paenibacillus larvae subsp. larvae]|uniref:Uncharacterized protein n=1 Tax=Paenibacillus larvae subsp. larvae TaxID=147375 RepID=A0A2L1UBW7_9BACL|nr:hypothetical protein B1222_19515 [Paenibacillus larvae subsp. pulvifaciens]AQZ45644.1 hypothetical protein B5S25_02540 [Paenibacillus larvae subsp. pulvifaciens]AVF25591.1 hypothetical protein ERICIII_01400 [Paenibacillus larvae subsp. larvae]AVF30368.1 hypothetical protein ERICIV_01421 [Paenibacillus larvae subsp. larvae]MBH0341409.1 hypothetical protein [Paenibacillus larvae]